MFHHSSSFLLGTKMRFLPVSGAQNPPWQRSGCLHYRIPAQPLSRKLVGEGGCGGILPGQGTAPSPECADKNSLPGTCPAGCLCHFRCGLCHGADRSPESTGCDSQLTFSINPLFCGPSSGTSRGTVFFIEAPLPLWVRRSPIRKRNKKQKEKSRCRTALFPDI